MLVVNGRRGGYARAEHAVNSHAERYVMETKHTNWILHDLKKAGHFPILQFQIKVSLKSVNISSSIQLRVLGSRLLRVVTPQASS